MSYDEIVSQISQEKKISKPEIEKKINKKLDSLSNLISKEGAAHIVANELGINLFDAYMKKIYKINEIKKGMRNINFSAKVIKVYDVNSFKNETREGKVGSLFVGDETGKIRVVLWDASHLSFIEDGKLKEGDIIGIKNAYSKENNRGFSEVHLNSSSNIELNPEGIDITVSETNQNFSLKDVASLKEGDFVEVRGTVRAVYPPRTYDSCPECNKKVQEDMACIQHGNVKSKKVLITNFLFDDGTETIRTVAFRENAETLLGEDCKKISSLSSEEVEKITGKIAGEQVKMTGRVSSNSFTGKLEFSVSSIERLDPEELSKELMQEVKVSEI